MPGDNRPNQLVPPGADPWVRLYAAVVLRAARDLQARDPVLVLDALAWWCNPASEQAHDLLGAC